MPEIVLIVNPASGGGPDGEGLVRRWAAGRPNAALRLTRRPDDARRLAAEAVAQGATLLVAAGGDGTASEVLNGLAPRFGAARLAIVPLGTGNDFARTAGIPLDTAAALDLIDAGRTRRIDVIRVTNTRSRYLLNAATGGFSDAVRRNLSIRWKSRLGPLAYLVAAARAFAQVPWIKARLTIDGQPLDTRTCTIIVGNGQFVAGGHRLAPTATLDDGAADLSIITAQTLGQRIGLLVRIALGLYLKSRYVIVRRGRVIHIEADPPMNFVSDGEPIGPTPLTFEVLHQALQLIAPPPPSV